MATLLQLEVSQKLILYARFGGMEPLVEVHALCELDVARQTQEYLV